MLSDIEPSTTVTGGAMSGSDPQALEMITDIMNKVFDYVCRQTSVTKKDLIIFMKQIGVTNDDGFQTFKEDDLHRMIQGMIFD